MNNRRGRNDCSVLLFVFFSDLHQHISRNVLTPKSFKVYKMTLFSSAASQTTARSMKFSTRNSFIILRRQSWNETIISLLQTGAAGCLRNFLIKIALYKLNLLLLGNCWLLNNDILIISIIKSLNCFFIINQCLTLLF